MSIIIVAGAVVALVLVTAYAMDRRARRRIHGRFEREVQVTAARSTEQYMMDAKQLGSGIYKPDSFRADDDTPSSD